MFARLRTGRNPREIQKVTARGGNAGMAEQSGPRAALYGGVSVFLLASAALPATNVTRAGRAVRLVTAAAAMGWSS